MYIYIWKDQNGVPFYVGLTNRLGRTNPLNDGRRNWLTRAKIQTVGLLNIVTEVRSVATITEGIALEMALITEYGRVQLGTGELTNLRPGGEGIQPPSAEHLAKLSLAMRDPNHPIRSLAARAKAVARMNSPDVKIKFLGEANPAKRAETRAKLKAKWEDPEYRAARIIERTGLTKNFSDETRLAHAERLKANPAMKGWGERNGLDPEFDAKRIAGIKASQPERAKKMQDPVALAQRKERLKATMNSPEYKAKRAVWDTPEHRQKLSDAKRKYWADKKAGI